MTTIQNTTTPATIFYLLNKLQNIEPDIREVIFISILPLITTVNGKFYPVWLEKYYEEYGKMTQSQKIKFNNKTIKEQVYLVNYCRRNIMLFYGDGDDDGDEY